MNIYIYIYNAYVYIFCRYPCYRNILGSLGVEVVQMPVCNDTNWQPTVAMLEVLKRAIYLQKSPTSQQKSPVSHKRAKSFSQKSQTFPQKSPMFRNACRCLCGTTSDW